VDGPTHPRCSLESPIQRARSRSQLQQPLLAHTSNAKPSQPIILSFPSRQIHSSRHQEHRNRYTGDVRMWPLEGHTDGRSVRCAPERRHAGARRDTGTGQGVVFPFGGHTRTTPRSYITATEKNTYVKSHSVLSPSGLQDIALRRVLCKRTHAPSRFIRGPSVEPHRQHDPGLGHEYARARAGCCPRRRRDRPLLEGTLATRRMQCGSRQRVALSLARMRYGESD